MSKIYQEFEQLETLKNSSLQEINDEIIKQQKYLVPIW